MHDQDSGQITHVKPLDPNGSSWQKVEQIVVRNGKVFLVSVDDSERHLFLGEADIPPEFSALHEPIPCQRGRRCQVSPNGEHLYARSDSPGLDPDRQAVTVAKCLVF